MRFGYRVLLQTGTPQYGMLLALPMVWVRSTAVPQAEREALMDEAAWARPSLSPFIPRLGLHLV